MTGAGGAFAALVVVEGSQPDQPVSKEVDVCESAFGRNKSNVVAHSIAARPENMREPGNKQFFFHKHRSVARKYA